MRYSIPGLALLAGLTAAVDPVEVRGQDFVNSVSGDRFVVIGVDYQPGGQGAISADNDRDVLSDAEACTRDAALMQSLGVNTIRSYNVDPTLNHDECMSIFNGVGIYVILDVNTPVYGQHIDRSNPAGTYTRDYMEHVFNVVEAFKGYPNLLGFFGGNEIINDLDTADENPPYMRAVQRDMKDYIAAHADRPIPVGYSAADVREFTEDTFNYLACDNGDSSASDFFGLNSYSWCGSESSFETAEYDVLVEMFSNASIPVFFSEYGCNDPSPRVFDEVEALYSPQMTVMSGGLVYEWSQEENNYGLVNISTDGSLRLRSDYNSLQEQYSRINVTLLEASNDTATGITAPRCSSNLIRADDFSDEFDIPSRPSGVDALISSGISNAPTGALVSVTATAVALPVYDTNSASMSNLAITVTSEANHPVGTASKTSSRSGSATASGASASPTGGAHRLSGAAALALGAAAFAAL
ncbi:glycoside hydrolase family 72 protein, partial [Aureobasidium melanogenum]